MRSRVLAWVSGATGGLVAYRLLRRRRAPAAELPPAGPDPRAEELREKLARAAPATSEPAPPPAPEPAPARDAAVGEDPDERRRHVHEQARATVDDMRRPPGRHKPSC